MKSKSYKKSGIFFGIALCLCFLARFVQIYLDVDKSTGNLHSSAVNGIFAPLVLLIVLVVGIILYILTPENKLPAVDSKGGTFIGVASFLSCVALIYDGYMNYATQKNILKVALEEGLAPTDKKNLELVTNISMILLIISVMAAIYFILLACKAFGNKKISRKLMAVFSLFLPLWCCIKLALDYINLTNMPILTEKIYDTITICSMALFFMANIRILSNVKRENSGRLTISMGFLSIFAIVVFTIPRYLMAIFSDYNLIAKPISIDIVNVAICLYIISYLTNAFISKEDEEPTIADIVPAEPQVIDTENIVD